MIYECQLSRILIWNVIRDHAGGNKELINSNTNDQLTVIGGDDRIDGLTVMIDTHGVDLQLGSLNIKCLRTPCHTTGHVCYYVNDGQDDVVFTGYFYYTIYESIKPNPSSIKCIFFNIDFNNLVVFYV